MAYVSRRPNHGKIRIPSNSILGILLHPSRLSSASRINTRRVLPRQRLRRARGLSKTQCQEWSESARRQSTMSHHTPTSEMTLVRAMRASVSIHWTLCTRDPKINGTERFFLRWTNPGSRCHLWRSTLIEMTQHKDVRAFRRWNNMLEEDQTQRLMDKYPDYGANVVTGKRQTRYPSIAPELERPPAEAASSIHQSRTRAQQPYQKGRGKEGGKI